MTGAIDNELSKDDCPVCVYGAVGDPVLLRDGGRGVDDEFVGGSVKDCCCFHFYRVISCKQHKDRFCSLVFTASCI